MRDIPGYEGRYAATSCGHIWSHLSKKFMKERYDKNGYKKLSLYGEDGKIKTYQVHRLIAMTYIDNPDNLPTVNHKDECKDHNWVDNLEWMDWDDNKRYGTGYARSAAKRSKPVYCYETDTVYESIKAAAAALNLHSQSVGACCKGKYKHTGGYHFRYEAAES